MEISDQNITKCERNEFNKFVNNESLMSDYDKQVFALPGRCSNGYIDVPVFDKYCFELILRDRMIEVRYTFKCNFFNLNIFLSNKL